MNAAASRRAVVLIIVSFLLSTVVSLVSLHTMAQRNVHEMNKVLATQIYDYISSEVSGPIMAARTMSSTSFLIDTLEQEDEVGAEAIEQTLAGYLSSIERGLGYQAAFVISDASRRYYTADGFNRVIDPEGRTQDSWYNNIALSKRRHDLDVDTDEKNESDLVVYVNARIEDEDGQLLGICGLGVRMVGMQSMLRSFEHAYNVKINLVAPDGVVQVDTDTSNIETANLRALLGASRRGEYLYTELGGSGFAVSKYVEDLGWFLVVRSDGANTAGQFANVVLLNTALCLAVLVVLFIALRIHKRRTDELASATFEDHATGLRNKRAYEHDKAELAARGFGADLVCVAIDVNGLKTVNDTLGHDAGDDLICGAAECLQTSLGALGTVYRTGGDEFEAILHASAARLEKARQELRDLVASWSSSKVDSLSMSCGYAAAREFPDETIDGLAKIADQRMYEDKDRYYASKGLKRRTT